MAKLTENDVLEPALRIIKKHPGCTMEEIIDSIESVMTFSPEDLEPLENRNDKKYSQIIRNLNSHFDTNEFGKLVFRTKKGTKYAFILNSKGEALLKNEESNTLVNEIEEFEEDTNVQNSSGYSDDSEILSASNRAPVLKPGENVNHRYSTDPKLSKTVIERAHYICLLDGFDGHAHSTFNSKSGHQYLEAHHLIPMKAQKDFGSKNLDRIENIVALCPNCHKAVHYGTIEEKKKYLKPLYDKMIPQLRSCNDHIDISFEDLINKYYK